jgi:hypothetical protein
VSRSKEPQFGLEVIQAAAAISWLVGSAPKYVGREAADTEAARHIWSWDNVDLYSFDNGNVEVRAYIHPSRAVSEQKVYAVIGYCRAEGFVVKIN